MRFVISVWGLGVAALMSVSVLPVVEGRRVRCAASPFPAKAQACRPSSGSCDSSPSSWGGISSQWLCHSRTSDFSDTELPFSGAAPLISPARGWSALIREPQGFCLLCSLCLECSCPVIPPTLLYEAQSSVGKPFLAGGWRRRPWVHCCLLCLRVGLTLP